MISLTAFLLLILAAADVTLDQIQTLAKVYLRDSAEVPMNVEVTTVVMDAKGKLTHRSHLTETTVFRGYSQGTGSFSMRANKQGLTPFGRWEAMSGEVAAFMSGAILFKKGNPVIEIRQSSEPGKPVAILVSDSECSPLDSNPRFVFPLHLCGTTEIALTAGPNGDLAVQHAKFDSKGVPARVKVPHMGETELRGYHYDVDFQLKTLPGEAKPYLWPLKTVVSATTDTGTVTVTNQYSAKR
jgi:hypothetical protein